MNYCYAVVCYILCVKFLTFVHYANTWVFYLQHYSRYRMATWLLGSMSWHLPVHARIPLDLVQSRPWWFRCRSHFSGALQVPSPASIEVEAMPYPQSQPDPCVFEDMTEEYSSVSTLGTSVFVPPSASEALASLVLKGDFKAADTLRREMIAHNIPIAHDGLYQRGALHAIRERRTHLRPNDRLEAFTAWMSLVPDRYEKVHSFNSVRQHIFRSMDHLNLRLVYRFGLALATKGYYCNSAVLQVVATLAQYAPPLFTENFLKSLDAECRKCHPTNANGLAPEQLIESPFNVAIKKHALVRRTDATLRLVKTAHERGVRVSDETLEAVLKHSTEKQRTAEIIHMLYPAYSMAPISAVHHATQNTSTAIHEFENLFSRMRALRKAYRSPTPPPPYALLRFVTDYTGLGRFHAIALLRKCAFRQSSRSAAAWVLAEMLYHRERKEHLRTLATFAKYFHLIGVPRKTILALLRGQAGKSIRPRATSFGFGIGIGVHFPPYPMKQRLWPSPSHTALAWEALVAMSNAHGRKRLYTLLLQLVERAKPVNGSPEYKHCKTMPSPGAIDMSCEPQTLALVLPPRTFDAAHFSPFVKTHAARGRPDCAAAVVADMVARGIQPGIMQWSMVARGFAQNGNAVLALRILDQLETDERNQLGGNRAEGSGKEFGENAYHPSDGLLGTFTNVLRGFILAGNVGHAREVERRLLDRLQYQSGGRPITDVTIAMLRASETRKP